MKSVKWAFASALILAAIPADAQPPVASTTRGYFSAHPVPFAQARAATLSAAGKRTRRTTAPAPATPPEIVALARALKDDPDLIYQYVHDNIQFQPLWGYLKGPAGTLLDGNGDAFDQAALMVALLNQASLSNSQISNVGYVFGQLQLSNAQLQSWLGVDSNPDSVAGVLASGGIPSSVDQFGDATLAHVWVQVSINGTAYVFDPAYKAQTWQTGIVSNLAGIMGYSQAQFLSDGGGTVTGTSISGVSRAALRNDLNTYANNLLTYVRKNFPSAPVNSVDGGSAIVPAPFSNGQTVRQNTNPNQSGATTQWAAIPAEYYAQFSVTLNSDSNLTQTFNSSDIYGHRLSVFFDSSLTPTLYLDGTAVVTGDVAPYEGYSYPIGESTSLPFATFAEQSLTQYVGAATNQNGGSAGYIIATGWGQVGRGMVEKHRTLLNQAIASGAASNSEAVLGETLAMEGYVWLSECAAQEQMSDRLLGTDTLSFYGGGIAGVSVGPGISSPYVDLPLNFTSTAARVNGSTNETPNATAAFLDSSGAGSSFESAALEQTQDNTAGFTAASTVKLLDIALQNNDTIFDIDNDGSATSQDYYTNTIRPQMAPFYNNFDLETIDSYVYAGYRVIAPLHGQIPVGDWVGAGFKSMYGQNGASSYAELITGGLEGRETGKVAGGSGGTNVPTVLLVQNADGSVSFYSIATNSPGGNGPTIAEPIDTRKGSYLNRREDLSTGPGSFPYGLNFERSYDSNAQSTVGPLGAGWTHSYAITATVGSDGFTGMGQSTLLSAVSSLVALYVSSDLVKGLALQGQPNLQQFVSEVVVNHWFTDQLTQNVVYVNQAWDSQEFTQLTDSSYAPEPGSTAILDAPSGAFRLRTNTGVTMNFNSSGQISSWTNSAGAAVTFGYSGGNLTTVSNAATGRQLTLSYNGSLVSSVTDGSRTVSYSYTNNNLTTYTDALQQATTYAYDTSGQYDTAGHLTQIFYPSNPANAFVTTSYDALGKVMQQSDANGNVTQTFFSGVRSESDDPLGNRTVWYFDPVGDTTIQISDYGPSPHLNMTTLSTYDAQLNLLTKTMPEGNASVYTYDAWFNRLTKTETPKPGSATPSRIMSYSYVAPVSSLPNFEEIQTLTDWNGNVITYHYDSSTGNLLSIVQPLVTKPGAGSATPTQTFTYTAIGLPATSQDAEGRLTTFQYDQTHADEVTSITTDSGRLNLTTQYGHNAYGDVNSVTDADGHTTTTTFDALRRILVVTAPIAGVATSYTYFPNGPIKTITRNAAVPEVTQYTYDLADHVILTTDSLGNTISTTYDADERVQTLTGEVTAAQNRQRTYTYDALSRIVQIADTTAGSPGQVLEAHTYTLNGQYLGVTDANGNVTTWGYDGLDRRNQTIFPDGSTETYQMDADANILQTTTRSGQTIAFTYDALNRTTTKTPQGEAAGQVTYGYDLTGRMLQAADTSSTTPYLMGYDTAGRVVSYTDQQGRNTQVAYDGVGNPILVQWPANTNGANSYFVTYQFDALNRMTEIDENGSPAAPLAKYQWDALSRVASIAYGDGTSDTYSQYDTGDNLLTLSQNFGGGQNNVTFNYSWLKNHQRQATAVSNPAFQYVPATGSVPYAAANVNNGYTNVGGVALTYDGNDNLTYDGYNTLTYDVENRLTTSQNTIAGNVQYFYDPLNRRKQKSANGVVTQFVLLGDEEIADFAGAGVGTAQTLTVRGPAGSPVAAITPASGQEPETVVYYHRDGLGTTVAATEAGQSGAAALTYNEFGEPGSGESLAYRFAGYRYDPETGLYYVRTRYYSPVLGRFLQTDPIGLLGGNNLYAYAGNDPLNHTDRTGLWFGVDDLIFSAGGGLIGVTVQLVTDAVINGQLSSASSLGSAFVGGAVTSEVALYTVPTMGPVGAVVAGASGAAAQNLTGQAYNYLQSPNTYQFNGQSLVFSTTVGGLTGLIPGASGAAGPAERQLYQAYVDQATQDITNGQVAQMFLSGATTRITRKLVSTSAGDIYKAATQK